jgi:multiple sugar transport system substrate-binding protein
MKDKKRERKRKVSRREFLKAGVAGLGMAAMGGLTEKAFGAPAKIKGTKLTILQGTYFIAPGQELYKKQAQEWGEANGVQMSADFLNWPDLQPKIAAAIQGGGVDIVELWPGWNYLYQKNLVDLTDMALEFGKRGGGFEKYVLNSASVKGRYLGIPHGYSNGSMNYRISWLKEAGCPNAEDGNKVDLTWDEYHAIAKKCKAAGHPFGQDRGSSRVLLSLYVGPWGYGGFQGREIHPVQQAGIRRWHAEVHRGVEGWLRYDWHLLG